MPKKTKIHKIHAEVSRIVQGHCAVKYIIRTFPINHNIEERYEIFDSQNPKQQYNFSAPTLDEVMQKFKESRGL